MGRARRETIENDLNNKLIMSLIDCAVIKLQNTSWPVRHSPTSGRCSCTPPPIPPRIESSC